MANKVHVVPHFHWDREWYFTTEESRILLVQDMEEVLNVLETRADYPYFVLDGQTAILEDYLAVKPENRERLKRLVADGKLIIGPWYTQTDEMVVGGESVVRNLLYGKSDCEEFGGRMMIGYLPDSFGQSAAMPQILNGFGITWCMFWRGTSERMGTDKTEFYWRGDAGSRVLVQLLPLGYAIGKYLPTEEGELKERLDKYFPVLDRGATTDHILLPNGHDQMPLQKNILAVMQAAERLYPGRQLTLGRYEDVFKEIEKAIGLKELEGEFLDGKYMRVHRSIYSTRADLKAANTRIENKLVNILEPLMCIAYRLGFEYQHGLVELIWKELLKNHAHDSIGCCCSDKVHQAIAQRFSLAEERVDQLTDYYMRRIVDAMEDTICVDKLTAFNLLPYERTGVVAGEVTTRMKSFYLQDEQEQTVPYRILSCEEVDAGLIDRQIVHYGNYEPFVRYQIAFYDTVPAMGYKTYLVREAEADRETTGAFGALAEPAAMLENLFYQIAVTAHGTLQITDKQTGQCYKDVLLLEDGSDDGDEYDYSPLADDYVLTSRDCQATTRIRDYGCMTEAEIHYHWKLPADLESRQQKSRDGYVDIQLQITLVQEDPTIRIRMTVDNQAKDHRLRVLIPGQKPSQYSVADHQFGSIRRLVQDPAMAVWEQEEWSERPDSIYPFLSYVHLQQTEGLAFLTNSVREYEVTGAAGDTLAVTILRSVGMLGKGGLYRRPGRPSGIGLATPDSQLPGKTEYQFALTTQISRVANAAREYVTPVVTYNKMPFHAMKLNAAEVTVPYSFSLFRMVGDEVIMGALKKAEQQEALIYRCYNPAREEKQLRVEMENGSVRSARLDETEEVEEITGRAITLMCNEVKTLMIR